MRLLLITIVLVLNLSALGANKYVRSGASGSASGDNWTDAYTDLPATLTRGNTYYIADGTYAGYSFNDNASGTTVITIKKAYGADHGTDTGWSAAYGDGEAVFGLWGFGYAPSGNSGYYDISGYTTNTAYGFRVVATWNQYAVNYESGSGASPQCKFRYIEFDGPAGAGDTDFGAAPWSYGFRVQPWGDTSYSDTSGMLISHCSLHGFATHIQDNSGNGSMVVEYSDFYDNRSVGVDHGNIYWVGSTAGIFRYNKIHNYNVEGVLMGKDNADWQIYGNVFYDGVTVARGIELYGGRSHTGTKIYNNTFVNLPLAGIRVESSATASAVEIRNNISLGSGINLENGGSGVTLSDSITDTTATIVPGGAAYSLGGSYTLSINAGGKYLYLLKNSTSLVNGSTTMTSAGTFYASNSTVTINGPASQLVTALVMTNIFVDFNTDDLTLLAATVAGYTLSSPFNSDMLGNTRGADGTWDLGGYEFVSGTVTNPPTIASNNASGSVGSAFSYQITATLSPTNYATTNLPGGLSVNATSGLVTGTPTTAQTSTVGLFATNVYGGTNITVVFSIGAAAGVFNLLPTSLAFPYTATNATSSLTMVVSNSGGGTLSGNSTNTSSPFSVVGNTAYSLAPGDTTNLTVRYAPTAIGSNYGTISFSSGETNNLYGFAYPMTTGTNWTMTHSLLRQGMSSNANNYVVATENNSPADSSYCAVWGFTVASAGTVRIRSLALSTNGANDSFYVVVNAAEFNDPTDVWDVLPANGTPTFNDQYVHRRGTGAYNAPQYSNATFTVSAGLNYVVVGARESGAAIREMNIEFTPTVGQPGRITRLHIGTGGMRFVAP